MTPFDRMLKASPWADALPPAARVLMPDFATAGSTALAHVAARQYADLVRPLSRRLRVTTDNLRRLEDTLG